MTAMEPTSPSSPQESPDSLNSIFLPGETPGQRNSLPSQGSTPSAGEDPHNFNQPSPDQDEGKLWDVVAHKATEFSIKLIIEYLLGFVFHLLVNFWHIFQHLFLK